MHDTDRAGLAQDRLGARFEVAHPIRQHLAGEAVLVPETDLAFPVLAPDDLETQPAPLRPGDPLIAEEFPLVIG